MNDWQTVTLADLGPITTGKTPPSGTDGYFGGQIPFVTPSDMNGQRYIDVTGRSLTNEGLKAVSRRMLPPGSILVSCIGSDMGKTHIARHGCYTNQQINTIEVVSPNANPLFVYYNLSARKDELQRLASGSSAQPILNKSNFSRIAIALPSLRDQDAIANLLGSLDDKIELNRRINETLEAMAQAIFRDWFVNFGPTRRKLEGAADPLTIMGGLVQDAQRAQALADLFPDVLMDDGLPEGWRETSLGAVAKAIGGIVQTGPFGSQLHQSDYVSAGLPVVMPANLTYSGFRQGNFSYVSPETTERLNKHRLKTGDIIYGRRGDIGRKALIGKYNEGWLCGTGCLKISFPAKPIPAEYLFYSLDHQNTVDWIRARAIGATMPNLNTSTLADMPLLYPSDASLAAFEQMVQPTLALREENDQQNGTLSATRDLLLPKLISGEIRLSEAEDLMEAAQ
ncbi:restriction endonuclease subunit S [Rhizobium hidalgonense]|uniref:restriction endonuclease subunit S n=1 Tax=Rhizobium hidalgonense TaxID=1538159 RepID=UPI0011075CBD|nr:restriction endonuclease subunit S [Rhizobium hidalgonense]QKK24728.1 restriction endonuclease subunit S [Rhizobium hidalgonense]